MNLEQTIQIISIITFITSIIVFFVKLGEYKNATNSDIDFLKKDSKQHTEDIKELKKEIDEIKTTSAQNSSRFEAILIEVKTKVELLVSMTGMFKSNENNKRSKG